MITTSIMQDASEIVHYNNQQIPLYIEDEWLSSFPDMRALCHWHEDMELIHITKGEMYYDINGNTLLLKEGDVAFVNSRQMHYGYANTEKDCRFLCILFHPSLLENNKYTYETYVLPVKENSCIESIYYQQNEPSAQEISRLMKQIAALNDQKNDCFELESFSCIYRLWNLIYRSCKNREFLNESSPQPQDLLIQKKMVSFIHQEYKETISLEDIAVAGNVSRSKCCILFKKYLQQSPVDFLNAYRLEVSCYLLKSTQESISHIATSCGFNHLSYFSKIFMKKYGCIPSDFRNSCATDRA